MTEDIFEHRESINIVDMDNNVDKKFCLWKFSFLLILTQEFVNFLFIKNKSWITVRESFLKIKQIWL